MNKYVIPVILSNNKKDWISKNQVITKDIEENINAQKLDEIVLNHLGKLTENIEVEVAFIGADFSDLGESLQEELLTALQKYIKRGQINGIRISIRSDKLTRTKLRFFKKYKVKTIELEVYSTNEYILKKIGMTYTFKEIKKAAKMIRFKGFKLGFKIMIGLPESTKIDDINTAKALIKLKANTINITPVLIIKGTELEKEYNLQNYKPLAVVQAVEICKEMAKMFNEKNIEIIAMGFEPIDSEINQNIFIENVVDGPFHPAFRSLVESGLWYDAIVNKIKKLNAKVREVEVTVNSIDTNNVIGYKQENIEKLKNTYEVDLIVTPDDNTKPGKSKIEVIKFYDN